MLLQGVTINTGVFVPYFVPQLDYLTFGEQIMARFTQLSVERLRATKKRQEIPDDLMQSLYLVIQPTGAKVWQVRYRAAGKHRRMKLGNFPLLSLKDARQAASEILRSVALGEDPAQARADAKRAYKRAMLDERDTIAALVEQYDMRHLSKLRSGRTVRRELDRHVVSQWGSRKAQDIARRDVLDLLDEIVDSGREVTANRVRAYMSSLFNWCVDRDVIASNPVAGVKKVAPETSRDRVLSDDEIRWFWLACSQVGFPFGPFGQMLLLTGQRLSEVAGMNEREIEGNLWCLPAERVKNKRAHDVPLSQAAHDILDSSPEIVGDGYRFTTTGRTPLSNFDRGRKALHAKMLHIAELEASAPVSIPHWTWHDLRRTAATGMARLGIPVRVTEAVLNHVSGTGAGIVGVYQRHDFQSEKREALDRWSEFVLRIVERNPGQILEFRRST